MGEGNLKTKVVGDNARPQANEMNLNEMNKTAIWPLVVFKVFDSLVLLFFFYLGDGYISSDLILYIAISFLVNPSLFDKVLLLKLRGWYFVITAASFFVILLICIPFFFYLPSLFPFLLASSYFTYLAISIVETLRLILRMKAGNFEL